MPSGEVHAGTSKALTVPLLFGVPFLAERLPGDLLPLIAGFAAGGGAIAGIFLSPDLDIDHKTISETWLIKAGWLFGYLFFAYWYPYARLIAHRSAWSHAPLFSTLLRVLYTVWPLLLFSEYRALLFTEFWAWFVVGLVVSDVAHWLMDTL
jgi:uncharacterized metal-binding protein